MLDSRNRILLLALVLLVAVPTGGSAQQGDDFFDSVFDGVWIGTLEVGAEARLLQLNLNVDGGDAIGTLFVQTVGDDELEVLAPTFGAITAGRLVLSYDSSNGGSGAAATTTLTLDHDADTDSVSGKATGAAKGDVAAIRLDPELPAQRIWTGTVKSGGENVAMALQIAQTEESAARFAADVLSGTGWVGDESGAITGTRSGAKVDLTVALPSGDVTGALKLKRKNNQLKGKLTIDGSNSNAKLVPVGGNNGKPFKVKNVQGPDIAAGGTGQVTVNGKNFGSGALVHVDDPDLSVTDVTVTSPKKLTVGVEAAAGIAAGTEIAVRVVNGDGQTAEKNKAITIGDDGDGGGGNPGVSFASDVQPIFTTSCATAGCHSQASGAGNLVLAPGAAFANIVNAPSSQQPSLSRIAPGNANNSYLVRKIRGDAGITGGRMPLNRAPLAQSEIDMIVNWANEGAANNGPVKGQ